MTGFEVFLYWWLLPALCVLLFQFRFFQSIPKEKGSLERWNMVDIFEDDKVVKIIIVLSIVWPIGVISYIVLLGHAIFYSDRTKNIMKLLIKEM